MKFLVEFLGRFNPNGSGIFRCTCCGCHDGCDEHCHEMERKCRIHGVKLPTAKATP